jgi:hypothetical protein
MINTKFCSGPDVFQHVEVARFEASQHVKVVRLSVLRTGHLYSQDVFLVLISVRDLVNPRDVVRQGG